MRKNNNTKPITIGTFRLGSVRVSLDADPMLEGGEFNLMEARITVGFSQNSWSEVVGILLHEALEFNLMLRGCKYRSIPIVNYDTADTTFLMDHSRFGRSCSDVGTFLSNALPALAKEFDKNQRRSKLKA